MEIIARLAHPLTSGDEWLYISHFYAARRVGTLSALNSRPWARIAHTVRTFLLANATAAIFGCRLSRLVNHPLVLSILFFAARMAERARGSGACVSTHRHTYPSRATLACRPWSFGAEPGPARRRLCGPCQSCAHPRSMRPVRLAASGPMPGIFFMQIEPGTRGRMWRSSSAREWPGEYRHSSPDTLYRNGSL